MSRPSAPVGFFGQPDLFFFRKVINSFLIMNCLCFISMIIAISANPCHHDSCSHNWDAAYSDSLDHLSITYDKLDPYFYGDSQPICEGMILPDIENDITSNEAGLHQRHHFFYALDLPGADDANELYLDHQVHAISTINCHLE